MVRINQERLSEESVVLSDEIFDDENILDQRLPYVKHVVLIQ